jgi:acyl-CoA thioester hydrolase
MIESKSTIRVRYAETDMMGVVYHGSYLPWLEVARTDMFRHARLSYFELEQKGYQLPVLSLDVKYHRPAVYDDEIEITAVLKERPLLRIHLDYELRRGNELIATASTEHAFINRAGNPSRPPAEFTDLMTRHFSS